MIQACILAVMILEGIVLDRGCHISLRRQLVGHLESRILGGQIGPGRRLPSVRRAEELLGLHRNTVAAAYRDLVQAGLARTRPGSGVYARAPSSSPDLGVALVTVNGARNVGLACADADLRTVLEAELRGRLAVRVHGSVGPGPEIAIRLAPGVGFLRAIGNLSKPALVSVFSGCERVHRIASATALIHGGDGIAYLPASPGNRDTADRASRLARLIAADYAALPWARHRLSHDVVPLPLISAYSWTEMRLALRQKQPGSQHSDRPPKRVERSLQPRVK